MKSREYTISIKVILTFISLSLFLSGCSKYVEYLESNKQNRIELKKETKSPSFCPLNDTKNLIHNSRFTFQEFPENILDSNYFNTFEKGILLTLFQFHVRPDSTDWSSRIQIHAKHGNDNFSNDFGPFNEFPLLSSFETLNKKGYLNKSIKSLVRYSNKNFPKKITIQKGFNQFLKTLDGQTKELKSLYKLGKPLQVGETYKRTNIVIPKKNLKNTKNLSQWFLVDKDVSDFNCSFDTGLYKKGIFLITKEEGAENIFGFVDKKGNYFFAVTKKSKASKKSYPSQLIKGIASKSLSPFCEYKNKNKSLILIGLSSRDPGQLLFHLFNYGIYDAQTPSEVHNYLRYPRHQFLTNPSRLLYESKKGTEKQLRYFLSLDFPIYHTENMCKCCGWKSRDTPQQIVTHRDIS
ncbi:MAG: hypothetical protein NXH75_12350 [Halobacteriovoraceae bacterium]|nr:hypothetical protein [Halobacteriovoraceae bacterium]